MNYLKLCQRTAEDCSLGPIASTANQLGMASKVVEWVNEAYLELQAEPRQWEWMRDRLDFPVRAGIASYRLEEDWQAPNVERFDHQSRHDIMLRADGTWYPIWYMDSDDFAQRFPVVGTPGTQPSPPNYFTLMNGVVQFNSVPDQPLILRAKIRYGQFPLVVDADEPRFADKFSTTLIARARMSYADHDGDSALFTAAKTKYTRLHAALVAATVPALKYRAHPLVR